MTGGGRVVLAVVLLCCAGYECLGSPVVNLDHGSVLGSVMKSQKNRTFYSFRAIPYAEPPERFQPPQPKNPWREYGPLDATKEGPHCIQVDVMIQELTGQEDCLVLNVYTLQIPEKNLKGDLSAVMVYIHGGAFECSDSYFYGPGRLMDNGIVLVTINYRLGPLGFLSTGDSSSPGNYGLLDQLEALKWVKKNIVHFGGDPDRITIFGNSAGGASVIYHMLSPLSNGLFNSAIAMSGSPLCSWAYQERPKYWAGKLGERIGCPLEDEDSSSFVACLREKSAEDIMKTGFFFVYAYIPAAFTPTVDNHFLPDTPENLLNEGKVQRVSFMTGIVSDEGALSYAMLVAANPSVTNFNKEEVLDLLKPAVDTEFNEAQGAKFIRKQYFKDVDYSSEFQVRNALTKTFSDGLFRACHYRTVKLMSDAGVTTYVYSYDYATKYSFAQFLKYKQCLGVGHMDELYTLFDGPAFGQPSLSKTDKKVAGITRALFTNFAKVNTPTPDNTKNIQLDWLPVIAGKIRVYHINDPITVDEFISKDHKWYRWWNEFLPELTKKRPGITKDEL